MGVDLAALVPKEERRLTDFAGRVLAIDAYNALYQFLAIIRQPDGTPLMDSQGRVTSHLSGLFYRNANLVEAGIRPVYVFDGKPPQWKQATLAERAERKVKAETERVAAVAAGDHERARSKASQTSRLTRDMVAQAKLLLDALGLPWVQAPSEGEAQGAHMARRGDAWAAASQDFDSLLFAAPRLVRNVTVTGKRKLPGRRVSVDVTPELIELERVTKDTELSREDIVAVGILCGTDYNAGIKGVGPKRAAKLVREHGGLREVLDHLGVILAPGEAEAEERGTGQGRVPVAWVGPDPDELFAYFLAPEVTDDYEVRFGEPDHERVRNLLCVEHAFSRERVDAALPRFAALAEKAKQRSLDAFF